MGRVDRKMDAEPGTCHYEVHISFKSVISLYVRIMSNPDKDERKWLHDKMMEVLKLLLIPKIC